MTIFVGPQYGSIPLSYEIEQKRQRDSKEILEILVSKIRKKPSKNWSREELRKVVRRYDEIPFRMAMIDLYLYGYVRHIYKDRNQFLKWNKPPHYYQGWP